jgi:hypothetical protein
MYTYSITANRPAAVLERLTNVGLPVAGVSSSVTRYTMVSKLTPAQKVVFLRLTSGIDSTEETADRYLTETEIPG